MEPGLGAGHWEPGLAAGRDGEPALSFRAGVREVFDYPAVFSHNS